MRYKLLFLVIIIFGFACQNSGTTKSSSPLESETKHPENYLVVYGRDKHNLFGQTVIKGSITNKATLVTYKDVDLKLEFYSKTGTLLETDHEVVYELIAPGSSKSFKTKYFAPKGSDSVALHVVTARPVNDVK